MVLKFPKVKKSKKTVIQPTTTILVVNFKTKELVGETEIDNSTSKVICQWGKKVSSKKSKKTAA